MSDKVDKELDKSRQRLTDILANLTDYDQKLYEHKRTLLKNIDSKIQNITKDVSKD